MDKKYIQENEIDIKYLRGQLSDDELELFEIYLMENPEMIEQLDLNRAISGGLIDHHASNSWFKKPSFLHIAQFPVRSIVASFATLCIGLVVGNSMIPNAQVVGSSIYLSSSRSASSPMPTIAIKHTERSQSSFMLRLQLNTPYQTIDKVTLLKLSDTETSRTTKEILNVQDVVTSADAEIALLLTQKGLKPGLYAVDAVTEDKPTPTRFKFNLSIETE